MLFAEAFVGRYAHEEADDWSPEWVNSMIAGEVDATLPLDGGAAIP
jgi:hypothetical protein